MQRIDRYAARAQATREFFGIQRRCQFRLSIKCGWVIEASTVEIVEQDSLSRRLLDARIAADDHDSPVTAADRSGEAIDEREMRYMIAEKLKFDAEARLKGWYICDPAFLYAEVQLPVLLDDS